nr:hypothetical protein [Nannocystis sp.]
MPVPVAVTVSPVPVVGVDTALVVPVDPWPPDALASVDPVSSPHPASATTKVPTTH